MATVAARPRAEQLAWPRKAARFLSHYGVAIAFVCLVVFFGIATHGTFTGRENLVNLSRQATMIGIISVGMTIVMISGGIDLSVGGIVGAVGIVTCLLQAGHGWPMWPAIAVGLLLGTAIGLWNGVFVSKLNIAPFIVTLGMMSIARGIALVLSKGGSQVPPGLRFASLAAGDVPIPLSIAAIVVLTAFLLVRQLGTWRHGAESTPVVAARTVALLAAGAIAIYLASLEGIPTPVAIWGIVAIVGIFLLNRTRFGRNVYAVGGNEEAARLSAVNVDAVKLAVYTLTGFLAAVSAIILSSRQAAAVPQQGTLYELDAIAAVVIGGTGLTGGYGTIGGTLLGVGIVTGTDNGLSLMNIDPLWQYIVKGLIISFAVLLDRRRA